MEKNLDLMTSYEMELFILEHLENPGSLPEGLELPYLVSKLRKRAYNEGFKRALEFRDKKED